MIEKNKGLRLVIRKAGYGWKQKAGQTYKKPGSVTPPENLIDLPESIVS